MIPERAIIIVAPMQIRIFVRKPAGFWLNSLSNPMIPPKTTAKTSFKMTSNMGVPLEISGLLYHDYVDPKRPK
jgi:hypothetical protein